MKIEYLLNTLALYLGGSHNLEAFFSIVAEMHLLHKTVLTEGYALCAWARQAASCQPGSLACLPALLLIISEIFVVQYNIKVFFFHRNVMCP